MAADLDRLATAAYLIGKHGESAVIWTRAHQILMSRGEDTRAVRTNPSSSERLSLRGITHAPRGGNWVFFLMRSLPRRLYCGREEESIDVQSPADAEQGVSHV